MSKMLTQIIYDLQKNTKLSIYTIVGGSRVVDGLGFSSSTNSSVGGMIKFYPTGSTEELVYVVEKLSNTVPDLPADNITYLGYESS